MGNKKRKRSRIKEESQITESGGDYISELPEYITSRLISYLPLRTHAVMVQVSQKWNAYVRSQSKLDELQSLIPPGFLQGINAMDFYDVFEVKKQVIFRACNLFDLFSSQLETARAERRLRQMIQALKEINKPNTKDEAELLAALIHFLDAIHISEVKKKIKEIHDQNFARKPSFQVERTIVNCTIEGADYELVAVHRYYDNETTFIVDRLDFGILLNTSEEYDSDPFPIYSEREAESLQSPFYFNAGSYARTCRGRLPYYFLRCIAIVVDESDVVKNHTEFASTGVETAIEEVCNSIANNRRRIDLYAQEKKLRKEYRWRTDRTSCVWPSTIWKDIGDEDYLFVNPDKRF